MSLLRGLYPPLPPQPRPCQAGTFFSSPLSLSLSLRAAAGTRRRACEFNSSGLALVPRESASLCVCECVCVRGGGGKSGNALAACTGCCRRCRLSHRVLTRNKRAKQQKPFGIFIVSPFAADGETDRRTDRETGGQRVRQTQIVRLST